MFTVAVTDLRWHAFHLSHPPSGVVNFWTPTLWKPKLSAGSRLFFMLKSPVRKIGGFGYVAGYREETVEDAWALFGTGNGVGGPDELRARVDSFAQRRSARQRTDGSKIGCILLDEAVFLAPDDHRSAEELGIAFSSPIVTYKRFDGEMVLPFETALESVGNFELVGGAKDFARRDTVLRPDQAAFRRKVMKAYGNRCAFLGTRALEAVDAAHIQPYVNRSSDHVQNGIPLRKDIHALFDAGLLAISDDYEILVSPALPHHPYNKLAGRKMRLPEAAEQRPSKTALAFHRKAFKSA